MKKYHSTRNSQYNSIEWIWTYYPKSTLLDQVHIFHDRSQPLRIAALEEPIFYGPSKFKLEDLDSGWDDTPVDILLGHSPVNENEVKAIEQSDFFNHLKPTRHYFPLFFLYYTFANSGHFSENSHRNLDYTPFCRWTYYCRAPRIHRYIFLNEASKNELLNSNIYTFNREYFSLSALQKLYSRFNYSPSYFDYKDRKYRHDKHRGGTLESDNTADQSFLHSAIQIAAETTYEYNFFTEKTFLPILLGKPVIVHGAYKANRALESLGFRLYDNIIDYSFDDIENVVLRTKSLVEQLTTLQYYKDPISIFNECKDIAEFNKRHALDLLRNGKGIPYKLIEWLNDKNENQQDLHIMFSWWYKYLDRLSIL